MIRTAILAVTAALLATPALATGGLYCEGVGVRHRRRLT